MGREICLTRRVSRTSVNKRGRKVFKCVVEEFKLFQTPTSVALNAIVPGSQSAVKSAYFEWLKGSGILDKQEFERHRTEVEDFCSGEDLIDFSWGIS